MKIEVRCSKCANSYLIDESSVPPGGGDLPCVGCGATIRVTLAVPARVGASPARAPATPTVAPPAPESRPAAVGARAEPEEVVCPRCSLHFVPRRAHAQAAASTPERRATVLLVEDMDYFLEIARDALGDRFDVVTANTLAEAHDRISRGSIDLMVIDVTLDGGDQGLELLRGLSPKRFPVIVFTAQDESEMYGEKWDQLRALGADDLVLKGMNVGEILLRKVAGLLGVEIDDDVTE